MNILSDLYFLNLLVITQILEKLTPEIILPLFALAGIFFLILGITGGDFSIFGVQIPRIDQLPKLVSLFIGSVLIIIVIFNIINSNNYKKNNFVITKKNADDIHFSGVLCPGNKDLLDTSYNIEIKEAQFNQLKEKLKEKNQNFQVETYKGIEHLPQQSCSALVVNNKKTKYQMNAEIFLLKKTIPERDINRTHCGIGLNKKGRIQLGLPEDIGRNKDNPHRFGHDIEIKLNPSCY